MCVFRPGMEIGTKYNERLFAWSLARDAYFSFEVSVRRCTVTPKTSETSHIHSNSLFVSRLRAALNSNFATNLWRGGNWSIFHPPRKGGWCWWTCLRVSSYSRSVRGAAATPLLLCANCYLKGGKTFTIMVAVAICCILVLLAVFIVLIIVVGQSMGES